MKADLTNENKARFFALYFGQKVFILNTSKIKIKYPEAAANSNGYLKLTPLSAITDEDAIEVISIMTNRIGIVSSAMRDPREFCVSAFAQKHGTIHLVGPVADFLRSRSYAVEWMGLSVEDLVSAGWAKLKQP